FLAVGMLGWHNVWMGRHAAELVAEITAVGRAVAAGERPITAMALAVGLAVLREGSEVVLFLFGIADGGSDAITMLAGGLMGLVAGAVLGYALYRGLVRLSMRRLFAITGGMILLLSAGLAAQGAKFLAQAGYLPDLGATLWDSSAFLSDESLAGRVIHGLTGYTARPSGIQLLFYVVTLVVIGGLMRWSGGARRAAAAAATATVVGLLLAPAPARADFKIDQPYVEEGEYELEYEGFVARDKLHDRDNEQGHLVSLGYGFTDYWRLELGGNVVRDSQTGRSSYAGTSVENVFQLTEAGEYWADAGLMAKYAWASRRGDRDQIELEPILRKDFGRAFVVANLVLAHDVGRHAAGSPDLSYGVQAAWRVDSLIAPAVEVFGDLGRLNHLGTVDRQDHRLGPGLVGQFPLGPGKVKYDVGYLFGLTGGAADGTVKLDAEYELRF
ncbi:MAG TPA: hypothetical protein HPQ04_00240, partial [Rhodospirillaceae bacterium]|nr:hypothetical protein [Rhodospirillaceae bacterium]